VKSSIKAAIYSALVFPGAGYFFVGQKVKGIISLILTLTGLAVLVVESFHKAEIIAEKIVMGVMPLDVLYIREQLLQTPGVFSEDYLSGILIMVGCVWFFSIVDSFRLGRIIEIDSCSE